MKTIHERLRFLRGEEAQDTFSAKLGLKQTTWGRYERGESLPDAEALQRICIRLSVEPRWLLFGDEKPIKQDDGQDKAAERVAEGFCPRCLKLEKELEMERESSRSKDVLLIEWLAKLEESMEVRLEHVKLQARLDIARNMCKEYQAENAALKARLSLSAPTDTDDTQASTA